MRDCNLNELNNECIIININKWIVINEWIVKLNVNEWKKNILKYKFLKKFKSINLNLATLIQLL